MMDTKELGMFGEEHAALYLEDMGYRILARNYRSRYGEIDIIAEHQETIVFVEVKARRSYFYGEPKESIHISKQRKLIRTAMIYLQEKEWEERECRFDAIEVVFLPNGSIRPYHIENAFSE